MINKDGALTPDAYHILCEQGTELPSTGKYHLTNEPGTYLCRRCGIALFRGTQKFISSCGWPSFDDEIPNRIRRLADPDGRRTEIRCQRCDGHLGHVFLNEAYTAKNLRHCVNSASIDFVLTTTVDDTEEAFFAGGCFWGVDSLLKKLPGVLLTEVGYMGGQTQCPTYEAVCSGKTGHLEAVRVLYDPALLDFKTLTKYFLEIHDPSQFDGQGPDKGSQYLSAIFYYDDAQKNTASNLLNILREHGLTVATQLKPVSVFWPAEEYHQRYLEKQGKAVCN